MKLEPDYTSLEPPEDPGLLQALQALQDLRNGLMRCSLPLPGKS